MEQADLHFHKYVLLILLAGGEHFSVIQCRRGFLDVWRTQGIQSLTAPFGRFCQRQHSFAGCTHPGFAQNSRLSPKRRCPSHYWLQIAVRKSSARDGPSYAICNNCTEAIVCRRTPHAKWVQFSSLAWSTGKNSRVFELVQLVLLYTWRWVVWCQWKSLRQIISKTFFRWTWRNAWYIHQTKYQQK